MIADEPTTALDVTVHGANFEVASENPREHKNIRFVYFPRPECGKGDMSEGIGHVSGENRRAGPGLPSTLSPET